MNTYHKLELFPYSVLPSPEIIGRTRDGINAGKDSPMFQNFLKLSLFSYFTKPSSPPTRALCFSREMTLTGAKICFSK